MNSTSDLREKGEDYRGAQELLRDGASITQIMAKVGWAKVDTVMR
jgi:hypothetical protein